MSIGDLLKITFVGYEPKFVSQPKGNLGTLKMSVVSSQLGAGFRQFPHIALGAFWLNY